MIEAFKKMLNKTNYRCAKRGKKLFLTRVEYPGDIFIAPEDFITGLHKQGLTINPKTLKISKLKEKSGSKAPKKKVAKTKAPAAKPDPTKLPTPEVVRKMKYNDLKALAADLKIDFPRHPSKEVLLKLVLQKLS